MYRFLIIVAFTALILGSALVLADIPQAINYQGVLFDSEGDPAPGSHSITFSIYDAAVDGTLLYQETHSVTVASDGSFDAILGRTPLTGTLGAALNGESRFLGITVGVDTEISPRTEMVSSPYSFKVNTLDGAEGGRVKGGMIIEHNQARSTQGLMILSGSGTFDTIMICPLTCSTILRATNTVGDEVLDISVDPGDNSALMVIKGPGGDDMSTLSAAGMDFSSASLTRAFQKRVSLRAKEGLQVFADGTESDGVAQLTPTAEGSELSFTDARRGVRALSISHKRLAV
ncbi:MAG: hypothetical protein GY841_16865, partial [FCB group bacterium]|nr:hypothetical protein [FCB group bacterium]